MEVINKQQQLQQQYYEHHNHRRKGQQRQSTFVTRVVIAGCWLYFYAVFLAVPGRCQTQEDVCENASCVNGSVCVSASNVTRGYLCTCTDSNFTGKDCDVQATQGCSSVTCQNGGTCSDQNGSSFSCGCADGYTGPLCGLEIDYCANLPCQQGTCVSNAAYQNYTCNCPPGYTGDRCETDIDDCVGVTCQNGGVCEDRLNDHFCNCTEGWEGTHCERDVDECLRNVCMHGRCENRDGDYSCDCFNTGYTGRNCQLEINECDLGFCVNGNCSNTEGNFTCDCFPGYQGANCSEPFCEVDICENGGTCSTNETDWGCNCPTYFGGRRCECPGPCTLQPCNGTNTERCVQDDVYCPAINASYTCTCKTGWEGPDCSEDIDECSTDQHKCMNGATCVNREGSYTCRCVPGYTGRLCETDIDECETQPCLNGGTCQDRVNNYTCNCTGTGFSGFNCDVDINECDTESICGNGNCTNTEGSFTCNCGTMYLGSRCQHVNPCHPKPCKNGGSCNHSFDGSQFNPVCSCVDGYQGDTCEQSPQKDDDLNILLIIVPIVAVILILVIIGVIAFVMVARKKRATRGAYSPSRQETAGSRVELGNVLKKPPEERLI